MRPTIVFLDHDQSSVSDIIIDLNGRETVSKPKKALSKEFDLRSVVVSATGEPEEIANTARAEIRKLRPSAILVDLNFIENTSTTTTTWRRGADTANELRKHFPFVPIGVYSQFDMNAGDRIRLSAYRFDVVLEKLHDLTKVARAEFPNSAWVETFERLVGRSSSKEFPSVFLSHAHADQRLATALADLMLKALHLDGGDIVASSVGGSGFPGGSGLQNELVTRLQQSECFVVLLTEKSVDSRYVWYETGLAKAAVNKTILPLATQGGLAALSATPIADLVVLRCEDRTDLLKLVRTVGDILGVDQNPPDEWERFLKVVLELAGGSAV